MGRGAIEALSQSKAQFAPSPDSKLSCSQDRPTGRRVAVRGLLRSSPPRCSPRPELVSQPNSPPAASPHQLEHIVPTGSQSHYLISGAGSETRDATGMDGTRFVSSRSGFLAMSLTPDTLFVQAVDFEGRMLYRTVITR